jgi:hypothetical protein
LVWAGVGAPPSGPIARLADSWAVASIGYDVSLHGGAEQSVVWPGELKVGMSIVAYGRTWIVFEVNPKLGTAQARAVERRQAQR